MSTSTKFLYRMTLPWKWTCSGIDGGTVTSCSASSAANPSGRGGYLLPTGYLSTKGNQITDVYGNSVRIDSIGWPGADGCAGTAPTGLFITSYQNIMASVKADGFNTIRISWSDVSINAIPTPDLLHPSLNPDLVGLTVLQIFDKIVAYAGTIGMKIIFDHHTNDGGGGCYGGQQGNGLWFDTGPGTDGTDDNGHTGTVSAAKFISNWVGFAQRYAGNSTVIGFDIDNEPTSAGNVNWGMGGPTDLWQMYTTVGNAILQINPGVLIIAEGPEIWSPNSNNGMNPSLVAVDGDLTGVSTKPVVLSIPNKVVYSVHEYPSEVSASMAVDSGAGYIQHMNAAWGFVEAQNIAPVWIGEMGSNLTSSDAKNWIATLVPYLNGADGAQGGPTFSGSQQPIGTSWWSIVAFSQTFFDGIQTALGPPGNYRPEIQAITDQLVYIPRPTSR